MATRSASAPAATRAADDYTYEMQVGAPLAHVLEAITDGTVISRWWTAATRSECHGDEVRLFMVDDAPFVSFTVEHVPESSTVTWSVTDCAVMADWVGTKPSFFVEQHPDGTSTIEFRHVGLRPALECFEQCRAGWNHFMPSLNQFLETGEGRPNEPRDPSA